MKPDQVKPAPLHPHRQALHERHRAHDQVRGAVALKRFELELYLADSVALDPLTRQRRPGDVAA